MIFLCREGIPTLDVMKRAEEQNSDGAGIAWVEQSPTEKEKNRTIVHWKKNLTADEVFKVMKDLKLEKHLPNYHFIIHFRAASIGGKSERLCQPFPIEKGVSTDLEGTAKKVLFHNGTYHRWDDDMKVVSFAGGAEVPFGPWNDSRMLAWLALNRGLGSLYLTNWGGHMNGSGRIAVLHADGTSHHLGMGWQDGEQNGVLQSGVVASVKTSFRHERADRDDYEELWNNRHSDARTRPLLTGGSDLGPRLIRPLKSSLYEEGEEVALYSVLEYNNILKEIADEQFELMRAN